MCDDIKAKRIIYETAKEVGIESCLNSGCVFGCPGTFEVGSVCGHLADMEVEDDRRTLLRFGQIAHMLALHIVKLESALATQDIGTRQGDEQ